MPHRPPDLCMMSVHLPASLESSAQSASCLQKQYFLARTTMLLLFLRVVFQGPSILLNDAPHVLSFHCILGSCCPPNSGSGITLLILPKQYCSDPGLHPCKNGVPRTAATPSPPPVLSVVPLYSWSMQHLHSSSGITLPILPKQYSLHGRIKLSKEIP